MKEEELWAVISLFGHSKIAGKISEYALGGTFVRVDVPACGGNVAFTKLYNYTAIFDISFVDKEVATAVAATLNITPVTVYDARSLVAQAVKERLAGKESGEDYDDRPF